MRTELLRRMQARGITIDVKLYEADAALIDRLLGYETARYVFGEQAEFARRLHDDPAIAATVALVRGAETQQELLRRASSATKPTKP
jgi:hypothetical protein